MVDLKKLSTIFVELVYDKGNYYVIAGKIKKNKKKEERVKLLVKYETYVHACLGHAQCKVFPWSKATVNFGLRHMLIFTCAAIPGLRI